MYLVSLHGTGIRIHSSKRNILAEIVSTFAAQEALFTRHPWFNCNSIAYIWLFSKWPPMFSYEAYIPGFKSVTPSPHFSTIPAPSCPRIQSPSTTRDPIRPAFQKCMSELYSFAISCELVPSVLSLSYPQIPVALICNRTSPGPGCSIGASTILTWWSAVTWSDGFGCEALRWWTPLAPLIPFVVAMTTNCARRLILWQ